MTCCRCPPPAIRRCCMPTPRPLLVVRGIWLGRDGDHGLLGNVVHPHGDVHHSGGACLEQGTGSTLPGVGHLGRYGGTLRPPWLDLEGHRQVIHRLPLRVAHGDNQCCCVPQVDIYEWV